MITEKEWDKFAGAKYYATMDRMLGDIDPEMRYGYIFKKGNTFFLLMYGNFNYS